MSESSVRLTVRDILAWLALLAAIIGSWADTRSQIALVRQEVTLRAAQNDREFQRMWKIIDEAQAAPGRK